MSILITNATLLTMDPQTGVIAPGAVLIEGEHIAALGSVTQLEACRSCAQTVIDAGDRLVMPGLICAHTHFYGAFARGMALPGDPPAEFAQLLERLWWRLDKALDLESVRLSALVCLIDAIRHGTTTLIDHHASPNAVEGSLDVLAESVQAAGVRASLCYEVSDRDGLACARAGMGENERFAHRLAQSPDPHLGATFGLHALMTLSPHTLETCAGLAADLGVGCHIHVAEGQGDVQDSLARYGCRVVERLVDAGVLGARSIAAHAIHIDEVEKDLLAGTQTAVVHNPRSNMNNAVGAADVCGLLERGALLGLGNDGFSNNMFTEMHTAYLIHKHAAADPRAMPADQVLRIAFEHNAQIAARAGLPAGLGVLGVGAPADLIVVDYAPPTPFTAQNAPWHVLFGIDGSGVDTVIVGGRVLMRGRRLLTLDEAEIAAQSRAAAAQLWERIM
ncbi:MAG: putative aminohydrolase SsnA [Anaerolineae bacterium]|nr:putative aminohydrolase SsnA [Anaerolineae bacterium]